jgi:hypothetical protein
MIKQYYCNNLASIAVFLEENKEQKKGKAGVFDTQLL